MVSLLLSEPIGIAPPRILPFRFVLLNMAHYRVFGRWTSRAMLS
ncbi:hypothetical protein LINGRAHAP2_LOCUS5774 [Linum grandiflorum]